MRIWMSDQAWNPDQDAEECQHERHQTSGKPCLTIDEESNCSECKRDVREYCPKHLVGWDPLRHQTSRHMKKERLAQGKGNGADPESQARQPSEP